MALIEQQLQKTVNYWQTWVKHCALPSVYQRQVIRSALTLKLHQYEETGAFIAATTTSIPEAPGTPRNWDYRYCWLRDSYYTVSALRKLSHFEEMEGFERYLCRIADRPIEQIQPVFAIDCEHRLDEWIAGHLQGFEGNGPVRIGNAAYLQKQYDSFGQMILALYPLYIDCRFRNDRLDKDLLLLQRLLGGIQTYLEEPDAGIWEFRGRMQLHTYSMVMHWAGSVAAAEIFDLYRRPALKEKALKLAQRATEIIENRCWNSQLGMYTQAAGVAAADAATLKLINLGFLDTQLPRSQLHLQGVRKALEFSPGLLHRYKIKDDFGDTHSCFLICSFWLAEALGRMGYRQEAITVFERCLSTANHLGLMSEDYHLESNRQWGNFPQTYSHVGLIRTAFVLEDQNHGFHYY